MSTAPPESVGAGEAAAAPVCPRHPDRESYVRCQRCERPACPECQRPAAVGVQCVDCVREQAEGSGPAGRCSAAALAPAARRGSTQAIIALCVVVYLLQLSLGDQVTGQLPSRAGS